MGVKCCTHVQRGVVKLRPTFIFSLPHFWPRSVRDPQSCGPLVTPLLRRFMRPSSLPDFFLIFIKNCIKIKNTTNYTFPTFHSEITFPQCPCPCLMSCTSCDHHDKRLFSISPQSL